MKKKNRNAVEKHFLEIANLYLDILKEKIKAEKEKRTQFTDFEDLK